MLLGIVLQSTFIRDHHRLHVRRWRAINRMAGIQASKHIALATRLVWIVEHASLGLLFGALATEALARHAVFAQGAGKTVGISSGLFF